METTEEAAAREPPSGRTIALVIFAVSVALCAIAPFANSAVYLLVPVLGVVSLIVSVRSRSWWTIPLGLLELISPAVLYFIIDYILWHS
ncbi:hypothetical protein ACTXJK_18165 [Brachybacterium tyrofermentans]|uniref:hypothetical protein n=1 Tax=Brachybacterium tyrofermentans TaxID=47848 RepID=UPI003FB7856C